MNLFITKRKHRNLYLIEYCWKTNIILLDDKFDPLESAQDMESMTSFLKSLCARPTLQYTQKQLAQCPRGLGSGYEE